MGNGFACAVTADSYQWYLPLWAYCVRRTYPECEAVAYVRGRADSGVLRAVERAGGRLVQDWCVDYPYKISTTNCLRFVARLEMAASEAVIIMDADLLLFPTTPDLWSWHLERGRIFAGHHGPWRKPVRPEVHGTEGWRGDWERVAGGYVMVTPAWYSRSKIARQRWDAELAAGRWGDFREADEVMLARILRESAMPIPSGQMPDALRGLHLGDFKDSMTHRFTNQDKMKERISPELVQQWRTIQNEETFRAAFDVSSADSTIRTVLERVAAYMETR